MRVIWTERYFCIGCSLLALLVALDATAAETYTWTGANSTAWGSSGNWSTGASEYPHYPNRNDLLILDDPLLVSNQPVIDGSGKREAQSITFNKGGWTIGAPTGANYIDLWGGGTMTSNGAGTNTIERMTTRDATPFSVGTGNTLVLADGTNRIGSKAGDGTLSAYGNISGFPNPATALAGTVLINGELANNDYGFSPTIGSGVIVGGMGSLNQSNRSIYTFASGSILAPGEAGLNDVAAGTLTFRYDRADGSRDFEQVFGSGSTVAIDLFAADADKVYVTGTSTQSRTVFQVGSGVTLALSDQGLSYNTPYTVLEVDSNGTYSGTFETVTLDGAPLTEGADYNITYTPHTAYDPGSGSIVIEVIPEPTSLLFVGIAVLAVVRGRKLAR